MTDQQFNEELTKAQQVMAEKKLAALLDRSAATALHTAAVMARNTWIEFFNRFSEVTKQANADELCKEMAAQLTALNGMVDRSAALLGDNK